MPRRDSGPRKPDGNAAGYVSCDYDPFHSVLHYEGQRLHVVPLVDDPAVLLWFEEPEVVDFKSNKQDRSGQRDDSCFAVLHPDRGLTLEFAAVAGTGEGTFRHQRSTDRGRSTYARIRLSAGQPLVIAGELDWETPAQTASRLAREAPEALLNRNERAIARATDRGSVTFRDRPQWDAQYALNKRGMLSAQDHGGALPAAFRSLYYLIWHMDGAMTAVYAAHCGWPEYLERWTRFQLGNPTWTDAPVPGWYFGQLVNGRISKQEEWGTYWAVWSAFTHWTQTGSREFLEGEYLEAMLASLDWLERLCYDSKRGAFGTYYRGKNPYKGSYDYGWDEAVGCPRTGSTPSHEGKAITRSYDFPFNLMMYNTYLMPGTMVEDGDRFLGKTVGLECFLRRCRQKPQFSAVLLLEDGSEAHKTDPPHWPPGTYFVPDMGEIPELLRGDDRFDLAPVEQGKERFVHQCFRTIVAQDQALFGSENLERFMDVYLPQCRAAGRYLQMPGALVEDVNCPDGSYHDNRPQPFSTGLMQAAMLSRGLLRLPFGLALRANDLIRNIGNYGYRGNHLDVRFVGSGDLQSIHVNGRELQDSLQLPEEWLEPETKIVVKLGEDGARGPTLMYSTVRLLDVEDGPAFRVRGYGKNVLAFRNMPGECGVADADGRPLQTEDTRANGWHYVEFAGRGDFAVRLGQR